MILAVASPFDAVQEFFACFDRGDLAGARRLLANDAVIGLFVSGEDVVELRGFDEFVSWYSRRRELLGDSFEYRVEEPVRRASASKASLGSSIATAPAFFENIERHVRPSGEPSCPRARPAGLGTDEVDVPPLPRSAQLPPAVLPADVVDDPAHLRRG